MATKKTRVMFIKYHEAADQQPLSKKAAEKLGIFPSLALGALAAWVRQNGYDVQLIDLHVENLFPNDAASRVRDYDPCCQGTQSQRRKYTQLRFRPVFFGN